MCRIAGFLDYCFKGAYDAAEVMTQMRDSLKSGGPDDEGLYIEREKGLALGHRRLSILDLSARGHQPMGNDDGSLWITYNGEVYNFNEIRSELESAGYRFKSSGDTEVVLKSYQEWGISCIEKFRGMFSFAIWDRRKNKLVLCRDRIGVKPLYYYFKNGLFMFASELKAFHRHPGFQKELDDAALSLYLQFGYIPAPHCIFKYARKLNAGCYLELSESGNVKEKRYWDAAAYYAEGSHLQRKGYFDGITEDGIADELEAIFSESFRLRLVSDVPVGIFLSGGLDSSLVTALTQKSSGRPLKTFSIGFHEEKYNEAQWAKKVAAYLGTDHTEVYCTQQDALGILPQLPDIYDEPLADPSTIPTLLLSRLASRQVKVCLSGDGGDEFFCGYPKYWIIRNKANPLARIPLMGRFINMIPPRAVFGMYSAFRPLVPHYPNLRDRYRKVQRILNTPDVVNQSILYSSIFVNEDLRSLGYSDQQTGGISLPGHDPFSSMMLYDSRTYLPDDILIKLDRAGMSVALETRDPLLDHKILEYTARLPVRFKYRKGVSKYILRKILYKHVPFGLLARPKQGFGIPIYEWFKTDLNKYYTEYLAKDRIRRDGFFNADAVESIVRGCNNENGTSHSKLWLLLIFQMWRQRWM